VLKNTATASGDAETAKQLDEKLNILGQKAGPYLQ
jgi:hypothetical protein